LGVRNGTDINSTPKWVEQLLNSAKVKFLQNEKKMDDWDFSRATDFDEKYPSKDKFNPLPGLFDFGCPLIPELRTG